MAINLSATRCSVRTLDEVEGDDGGPDVIMDSRAYMLRKVRVYSTIPGAYVSDACCRNSSIVAANRQEPVAYMEAALIRA